MAVTFGRRNPPAELEAFQEKGKALAQKVGLKTEGPDGVFPSESDFKALVAGARASLDRRTEEIHKALAPLVGPECQMVPFYLIPESCWVGETGQYLVEFLRLTPYGEWNTAFLPGNAWTAALVGTALHPRAESLEFTATMKTLILDSKRQTGAVAEEIKRTGNVTLMLEARNRALALVLTTAKKTAASLADIGKPPGRDSRAGLSFLSLTCVEFRRG